MKTLLKFTKCILILFCFILSINMALAQDYGIKIIPLDFISNPQKLWEQNDKLYVSSINYIDTVAGSSIIELDYNLDTVTTYFYPNIIFGRESPEIIGDRIYAYCGGEFSSNMTTLMTLDGDYNELRRDTFDSQFKYLHVNSMNQVNGEIIGVGVQDNDCEPNCFKMNIKTIDTEGSELSSFNLIEEENYFFSSRNSVTSENHILIGGIIYSPSARASLIKVSTEGTVIWCYKSNEKSRRGNVPINSIELSNGNIVYTDKLNKFGDNEYEGLGFTFSPNQLVWLSPEGDSLMSYLDTVNWQSSTEYFGLTKGNGDYFFVFGDLNLTSFDADELDGWYSLIMKISNDGQILWRRSYRIDGSDLLTNNVSKLIELDNGDIITVGTAVFNPTLQTVMMHLDENGCFGKDDCDEIFITTNTVDHSSQEKLDANLFYPIPATDRIYLHDEYKNTFSHYNIIDMHGNTLRYSQLIDGNSISIDDLTNGVYIVQVSDGNRYNHWQSIVVQR